MRRTTYMLIPESGSSASKYAVCVCCAMAAVRTCMYVCPLWKHKGPCAATGTATYLVVVVVVLTLTL